MIGSCGLHFGTTLVNLQQLKIPPMKQEKTDGREGPMVVRAGRRIQKSIILDLQT